MIEPAVQDQAESSGIANVTLRINGKDYTLRNLDARTTLLDALREHLQLTGTKKGCDHGQCGACTVLSTVAGRQSCLLLPARRGRQITTIEGVADGDGCTRCSGLP